MNPSVFFTGLTMGLSLIVAIGAQNAFVLRQGLRNEHLLAICLTCALSDAVLILVGVTSFAQIAAWLPWVEPFMRYGGAAFLLWYGARNLHSALHSSRTLDMGLETARSGLAKAVLACLAITWLNPHVYLDTMVMLGTISTQFPGQQGAFAAGAISASFLFFFLLGYGATWLRPVFAKARAWRVLEAVIAAVMWAIALRLLAGG